MKAFSYWEHYLYTKSCSPPLDPLRHFHKYREIHLARLFDQRGGITPQAQRAVVMLSGTTSDTKITTC
jgi:hypothetical protein